MAMNIGSDSDDGEEQVNSTINTTPLLDVMMVLLILLIITIPIQTHAVKLNMPVASKAPPPQEPIVITISVDFDGLFGFAGVLI